MEYSDFTSVAQPQDPHYQIVQLHHSSQPYQHQDLQSYGSSSQSQSVIHDASYAYHTHQNQYDPSTRYTLYSSQYYTGDYAYQHQQQQPADENQNQYDPSTRYTLYSSQYYSGDYAYQHQQQQPTYSRQPLPLGVSDGASALPVFPEVIHKSQRRGGGGRNGNARSRGGGKMGHGLSRGGGGRGNSGHQPIRPDSGGPPPRCTGHVGIGKGRQHNQPSSQLPSSHAASVPPLAVMTASTKEPTADQVSADVLVHPRVPLILVSWCDICRVYCNTLEVLEQHKNGKRHKKTVKIYEEVKARQKLLAEMESQGTMCTFGQAYDQPNGPADSQTNATEHTETVEEFAQAYDQPKTIPESQFDATDQQNSATESHSDGTGQQDTITVSHSDALGQQETITKSQSDHTEQLPTTLQIINEEHGIQENNLLEASLKEKPVPHQPTQNVFELSDDIPIKVNSTDKSPEMWSGNANGKKNPCKRKLMINSPDAKRPRNSRPIPERPKHQPQVCEVCNITCDTEAVFTCHLAGKKHIAKVKRLLSQSTSHRSVCNYPAYRGHEFQSYATGQRSTAIESHSDATAQRDTIPKSHSDAFSQQDTIFKFQSNPTKQLPMTLQKIKEHGIQANNLREAALKDNPAPDQPTENVFKLSEDIPIEVNSTNKSPEMVSGNDNGKKNSSKRKLVMNNPGVKRPRQSRTMLERPKHQPQVCKVCNITCDTEAVFMCHLAGKKHIAKSERLLSQTPSHVPVCDYPAHHGHDPRQ